MSWGQDGLVYGVFRSGVMRLSPTGAGTETLVRAGPTETIVQPQLLPGGRSVLFTLAAGTGALDFDRSQIVVQAVGSQQRKVVIDGGSDAWYLPTGHIVYALGGVLWAVPFNVSRLEVTGGPVSIVEGIARGIGAIGLATAQFNVSENGTLVYVPGPATTSGSATRRTLVVIDTQGRTRPLPMPAAPYSTPRVSPDGRRLAVVTDDDEGFSLSSRKAEPFDTVRCRRTAIGCCISRGLIR
jgi:eukaryotic-like serine/threonine-protein kinase